jgi:hypothetical protein
MKKCAPSFPKLEKEKFGAQRKIWILEEKFGINCDLRWIIWNKLFFGRGPIWHREGYYYIYLRKVKILIKTDLFSVLLL